MTAVATCVSCVAGAQTDLVVQAVAFGSCARQNLHQGFWEPILASKPDLFILAGDNIYSDTTNMNAARAKYAQLGAQPGFQAVKARCPILATWDDHDYGLNDSGSEFRERVDSQRNFLDFFGVPEDSPRRRQEGVYSASTFGPPGRRLQVILLDTRYFRTPLLRQKERFADGGRYSPTNDPEATILGSNQWAWLEARLREPADVRLLVSSIQVVANGHHWEKWGNFPQERARLIRLIRDTRAAGLVLLSGDRHRAELSCLPEEAGFPLYDLTASGLNVAIAAPSTEPNACRVGESYPYNHFGFVRVDWEAQTLSLEIRDMDNRARIEKQVRMRDLQPRL